MKHPSPIEFGKVLAKVEEHGNKLDIMGQQLSVMNETLVRNTQSLEEHMKQSLRLDQKTDMLRQEMDIKEKEILMKIEPIQAHVQFINRMGKIVVPLLAVPASIYYIVKFFTEFVLK